MLSIFIGATCLASTKLVGVLGFTASSSLHAKSHPRECEVAKRSRPLFVTLSNGVSAPAPPAPIRLTTNEKARTVTACCTSGTLCTTSAASEIEGAPFGSFVDFVLDDDGNPVFLMNEMSMHTVNIRDEVAKDKNALVTLFVQFGSSGSGDKPSYSSSSSPVASSVPTRGQDVSRCSLTGIIEEISISEPPQDIDQIRMRYSLTHVYADRVMDNPKFHFYRLRPRKIYYVGGFGVAAGWIPVEEYRNAEPDILAKEANSISSKLNIEEKIDLELVALHLLELKGVQDVSVTGIDRLGMDLRVNRQVSTGRKKLATDEFRVGFRIPVLSVEDAKSEIVKIFQEAWEKGQGYTWANDNGEIDLPGSDVPIMKIAEDVLG